MVERVTRAVSSNAIGASSAAVSCSEDDEDEAVDVDGASDEAEPEVGDAGTREGSGGASAGTSRSASSGQFARAFEPSRVKMC